MSEIITVARIIPPKDGKKKGAVVDSTGKWWGVWADKLPNYKQFGTYEVLEHDTNEFQGKTYYTIKKALLKSEPKVGATNAASAQDAAPTYDDNQRRMDIFVCGAFNNIMSNPNMSPFDLSPAKMVEMLNTLKSAWKSTLGP